MSDRKESDLTKLTDDVLAELATAPQEQIELFRKEYVFAIVTGMLHPAGPDEDGVIDSTRASIRERVGERIRDRQEGDTYLDWLIGAEVVLVEEYDALASKNDSFAAEARFAHLTQRVVRNNPDIVDEEFARRVFIDIDSSQ